MVSECDLSAMVQTFLQSDQDFRRKRRHDCVAKAAPCGHTAGNPINQQAKAGLGAPRFSIVANDPLGVRPKAAICLGNWSSRERLPTCVAIPALSFQSRAEGVTQVATSRPFSSNSFDRLPLRCFRPPRTSATVGVGHRDPVKPLSDMGGVHGASWDIDRPAGVTFCFQISGDSVEPIIASLPRNLLSHEDRGPGGTGEAKDVGPQMPWIVSTGALARDRERLAGTRGGPERVVRPSCELGGECPSPDSGEQVDMAKSFQVFRLNINDAALIHQAGR